MRRVLVTGMSGAGKSSVIRELAARGHHAVDTDSDEWSKWVTDEHGQPDWVWREGRMAELLERAGPDPLFVCGCKTNQGQFYRRFERVVLLSTPADVLLRRVAERTDNPYGQTPEQRADILEHLEFVEPLLRAGAHAELDSARLSTAQLADALEALAAGIGA